MSSYEKFVMDADQLGVLHGMANQVDVSENGQAMGAIREVGPGGHFLGCAHTQENFKSAFWRTELLDYRPFETWQEDGGSDTQGIAGRRVREILGNYQQPPLDDGTAESLNAFVRSRKDSMPDSMV